MHFHYNYENVFYSHVGVSFLRGFGLVAIPAAQASFSYKLMENKMAGHGYDKTVKIMMNDFVKELQLTADQEVSSSQIIGWFRENYPNVKDGTVRSHLIAMSTNAKSRIHHNVNSGSGHDLFYQIDSKTFRLYEAGKDPSPIYKDGYIEKPAEFGYDDSIIQGRFQMTKKNLPQYASFMNPVLQALKSLGGSGTIEEINNKASEIAGLSDEQLEVLHNAEKGGQTEVEYRLAWARTYLKNYGVIENSSRGVWALITV